MKLRLAFLSAAVLTACAADEATHDPVSGLQPAELPSATPVKSLPPKPDAGVAPSADATPQVPVVVPGIGEPRFQPLDRTSCGGKDETPIQPEDMGGSTPSDEFGKRPMVREADEEKGGLDKTAVLAPDDLVVLGPAIRPEASARAAVLAAAVDSDGDCLSDADEAKLGTDPHNPDSDGDGWYDGPCNLRYKLVLTQIWAHDEQEDLGDDEFYLVVDDVRHPQADLDDYWDFDDGDVMNTSWTLATRVRGVNMPRLAPVTVEGWEDDFEIFNTWTVDDLLFTGSIDLGQYKDGDVIHRRFLDPSDDDYDYELTYKVVVERFADPSPKAANGDGDHDGISEQNEARVSRDFGGIADPTRPDVFVEVDWMPGHALRTEGKRQVTTQYYRNGIFLHIFRNQQLAFDNCLTIPEARQLYADHFDYKGYGAFRYSIIGEQIWNDRSGVAWGDIFLVDDSTWWINNWVMPQAGTFIHELGHTMGLTKDIYSKIDTVTWPSYDSAMNYLYQAIKVDYSYDGAGGDTNDHDDWGVVNPAYGLRWSFALTTDNDRGICN